LKAKKLAQFFNLEFFGNPNDIIEGISSIENPKKNHLVLISKSKFLNKDLQSCFLLISENLAKEVKDENIFISKNPKLDFALISKIFTTKNNSYCINNKLDLEKLPLKDNIKIGQNFIYGKNLVIEDNVVIGDNVSLGHNVIIKKNVKIGDNVFIDSGSVIGSEGFGNVKNSKNEWIHMTHLGGVEIHNNVSIGSNCCIDRGTIDNTTINSGVIIDNLVHIAHNVSIGKDTAIAAKVGIAGSCNIGKRNMIGGMVGIVDHINTADDVSISATSSVIRDLKESGTYTGIMPISKHDTWKRIALWITKLDKIAQFLKLKSFRL